MTIPRVFVAVPSIGRSPLFAALLDVLWVDPVVEWLTVWDNSVEQAGAAQATRQAESWADPTRVDVFGWPNPRNLSRMWLAAQHEATAVGATHLVCLNDDITLTAERGHPVGEWVANHDACNLGLSCPSYLTPHVPPDTHRMVFGTYRDAGLAGFAWCLTLAGAPEIDEQFEWWGGDDDLVWSQATTDPPRAVGIIGATRVAHPCAETTAHTVAWTHTARNDDRARLHAKWGRTW